MNPRRETVRLTANDTTHFLKTRAPICAIAFCLLTCAILPALGNGPAGADAVTEDLIAAVRQKSASLLRLSVAVTNVPNLAEYISLPPSRSVPGTNIVEVAPAPTAPDHEQVFLLRGIMTRNHQPMALINKQWRMEGDLVASNGIRISKIGDMHVILVDTQGVQRTLSIFKEHE